MRGLELIPADADLASGGFHVVVHVPMLDTPYGIVVVGEAIHQAITQRVQFVADALLGDASDDAEYAAARTGIRWYRDELRVVVASERRLARVRPIDVN